VIAGVSLAIAAIRRVLDDPLYLALGAWRLAQRRALVRRHAWDAGVDRDLHRQTGAHHGRLAVAGCGPDGAPDSGV
jgi:hypothetical protein